jgi:hypothetical protein
MEIAMIDKGMVVAGRGRQLDIISCNFKCSSYGSKDFVHVVLRFSFLRLKSSDLDPTMVFSSLSMPSSIKTLIASTKCWFELYRHKR